MKIQIVADSHDQAAQVGSSDTVLVSVWRACDSQEWGADPWRVTLKAGRVNRATHRRRQGRIRARQRRRVNKAGVEEVKGTIASTDLTPIASGMVANYEKAFLKGAPGLGTRATHRRRLGRIRARRHRRVSAVWKVQSERREQFIGELTTGLTLSQLILIKSQDSTTRHTSGLQKGVADEKLEGGATYQFQGTEAICIKSQNSSTRLTSGLQAGVADKKVEGGATDQFQCTVVEILGRGYTEDLNAGRHFLGNPRFLCQTSYKAYALFTPKKLLFKPRISKTVGNSMFLKLASLLIARWRHLTSEDLVQTFTSVYGTDRQATQQQLQVLCDRRYISIQHDFISLQSAILSRLLS